MKKINMYLLDTLADWENGYFLQGLTLQKMLPKQEYELCTVATSRKPIKTAGGMTLIPDITLDELDENQAAALLLIGADTWGSTEQTAILEVAKSLIEKGVLVAAICGATLGLANVGILDTQYHTSNALFFLTGMSSNYNGEQYYKDVAAVADDNLITASSAGSLLWAKYIFEKLEIYSSETIEAWYNYFSTGKASYFGELMNTFSK